MQIFEIVFEASTLFSTGFLGRVLLKTPISTRVVDNGNKEMERPTRRVSDNIDREPRTVIHVKRAKRFEPMG